MQIPPYMPTYPQNPSPGALSDLRNLHNLRNDEHPSTCECETCASRRYQDDSLDGGVSFQQPTRIHPSRAATAVIGHEREHQGREARFAAEDGREIILNEISIYTSICPECNRVYVSGGETRTMTRESNEQPVMSVIDVLANMRY